MVPAEQQTLLVPVKFLFSLVSQVIDNDDEDDFSVIAKYEADDILLSLIHVAFELL